MATARPIPGARTDPSTNRYANRKNHRAVPPISPARSPVVGILLTKSRAITPTPARLTIIAAPNASPAPTENISRPVKPTAIPIPPPAKSTADAVTKGRLGKKRRKIPSTPATMIRNAPPIIAASAVSMRRSTARPSGRKIYGASLLTPRSIRPYPPRILSRSSGGHSSTERRAIWSPAQPHTRGRLKRTRPVTMRSAPMTTDAIMEKTREPASLYADERVALPIAAQGKPQLRQET